MSGAIAIEDREFSRFQNFVYREAGIFLSQAKRSLVAARLGSRLRALGVPSFRAYWDRLDRDRDERRAAIEALCTHETSFFRQPAHFRFVEEQLAPAWQAAAESGARPPRIRAWSAGCSSGQEPFSLAMTLLHALPGFGVDVFATDLSTRVLERARAGTWAIEKANEIPPAFLKAFMLRGFGPDAGRMRAGAELRDSVLFAQANLNDPGLGVPGGFDVIFCRNVLIYFDETSRRAAVGRLVERLAPGGHLFVGHAETLSGFGERLHCVSPTVYRLRA